VTAAQRRYFPPTVAGTWNTSRREAT
jgi:hypothetical protein